MIYLKIFYATFYSKGETGENFFEIRNSVNLNRTKIYGNLTGVDVREMAKNINKDFLAQYQMKEHQIEMPKFENHRKIVDMEQILYMRKSPFEFQIGRYYEETLEILDKSLNSQKCLDAQKNFGFSDMAQYFLEDNKFLRLSALMKYLVNPDYSLHEDGL